MAYGKRWNTIRVTKPFNCNGDIMKMYIVEYEIGELIRKVAVVAENRSAAQDYAQGTEDAPIMVRRTDLMDMGAVVFLSEVRNETR